jgi:hypothetical protein
VDQRKPIRKKLTSHGIEARALASEGLDGAETVGSVVFGIGPVQIYGNQSAIRVRPRKRDCSLDLVPQVVGLGQLRGDENHDDTGRLKSSPELC